MHTSRFLVDSVLINLFLRSILIYVMIKRERLKDAEVDKLERIYNIFRNFACAGLLFILVVALYIPVEDQYGNENNPARSIHEEHKHAKAPAVQKPVHSSAKHAAAGKVLTVLFSSAAIMMLPVPLRRYPFRSIILRRLSLLLLSSLKFTSNYVSFSVGVLA